MRSMAAVSEMLFSTMSAIHPCFERGDDLHVHGLRMLGQDNLAGAPNDDDVPIARQLPYDRFDLVEVGTLFLR